MLYKLTIIRWEKRDISRKNWEKARYYLEKMTRREEVYTSSIGGTGKKARFESLQNAREQQEPADACERRDDNAIGTYDVMQEYLDKITAASTGKPGRRRENSSKK